MENERDLSKEILRSLSDCLGMVVVQSPTYDFSYYTNYYEREMGKPLWKTIYFFEFLKEPEFLIPLKHLCYEIERSYATPEGNRRVNLDPGYLTLSKVVLSTFKDYAHRIYLGNSVFAEVTLIFKEGTYQILPWTYPDYRSPETIESFNKARKIYKERLDAYR